VIVPFERKKLTHQHNAISKLNEWDPFQKMVFTKHIVM